MAESKSANVARVITTPIKVLFAAVFFISIGALMDVSLMPIFLIPAMLTYLGTLCIKVFDSCYALE